MIEKRGVLLLRTSPYGYSYISASGEISLEHVPTTRSIPRYYKNSALKKNTAPLDADSEFILRDFAYKSIY
jgi:hypothetical protein